jgi:predicted metal-dependent HD superfamily phosphohydrolase
MRFKRNYADFFDMHFAEPTTVKHVRADLDEHLGRLLSGLGVAAESVAYIVERWWWKMTEPIRHYHTPVHVMGMFCHADKVGFALTPIQELAVWFHDSVYDPVATRGTNEEKSAAWMSRLLAEATVPRQPADDAASLIRWTAHHADVNVPKACYVIMDLDLAGLATDPDNFARQSEAVRKEGEHQSDNDYAKNTIGFFERLLARKHLYRTPEFTPLEQVARQQLSREIERLSLSVIAARP